MRSLIIFTLLCCCIVNARLLNDTDIANWNLTRHSIMTPMTGYHGVDVSTAVSTSSWKCMREHGIHFAVVRGWEALCHADPNVVQTVKNAHAAGVPNVDIYLFPSYNCHLSATQQVDSLIAHMGSTKYGMIWLDIESGAGWSNDAHHNLKWIQEAASRIRAKLGPKAVGIYASQNSWNDVCKGIHAEGLTEYPLWYPHYDNNPSFHDFSPFAGFGKPAIKQYKGTGSLCGAGVDMNWYP